LLGVHSGPEGFEETFKIDSQRCCVITGAAFVVAIVSRVRGRLHRGQTSQLVR